MQFKTKFIYEIIIHFFNRTSLYLAVEIGNHEIVKLLLSSNNTDPNIPYILYQ